MPCLSGVQCVLVFLYLLVSSCKGSCGPENFMSFDSIKQKSPFCLGESFPKTVKPIPTGLYLMPSMNFTCSGSIQSVIIGAKIIPVEGSHAASTLPSIQVWSPLSILGSTNYISLKSTGTIDISKSFFSPNGYFYYNFNQPLSFASGDFIGFHQPSNNTVVRLFYSTETFRPQQNIYIDPTSKNLSTFVTLANFQVDTDVSLLLRPKTSLGHTCLNGFLDFGEIKQRSGYINPIKHNSNQLRMFPNIKFSCKSFIKTVTFGAQTRNGASNTKFPELQIWRRFETSSIRYLKVHTTRLTMNESNRINNVHELYLDNPVQVSNQDFIGILQPKFEESRLVVLYQESGGPQNFLLNDDDAENQQSIIAVNSELIESSENDYPFLTVSAVTATVQSSKQSSSTIGAAHSLYLLTASQLPAQTQTVTMSGESSLIQYTSTSSAIPAVDDANNSSLFLILIIIGVLVLILLVAIIVIAMTALIFKVKQQKKLRLMLQHQQSTQHHNQQSTQRHQPTRITTSSNTVPPLVPPHATSTTRVTLPPPPVPVRANNHDDQQRIKMKGNFSYGVFSLKTAVNPAYNNDISRPRDSSVSDYYYVDNEAINSPNDQDDIESSSRTYY